MVRLKDEKRCKGVDIMKKTKNGRNAYFIVGMCLAFCLLFILLPGVVCLITYRNGNSDTAKVNRALQAYQEFLRGERSVGNEDVYQLITPTGEPERRYASRYCIWDVNGDGIPELHFYSGCEYTIYTFENNEMKWFQAFPSGYGQYILLESGAFIFAYSRWDDIRGYYYFELNEQGEVTNELRFACIDPNENNGCDRGDEYEYEYEYEGVRYTKEEWFAKTEKYIFLNEEGEIEVKNPVTWTVYCEAIWGKESDDVLEQIRRGDFTSLRGLTETELEELERIYGNYRDSQGAEMIYADINGDGASELIWQEKDGAGIESVHRILAVFTVASEGVRRIVWDVGDMGEFYFWYHDKIIYTTQYLGPYDYYYYGICECGTDGELRVIKSFEVYDLRELTEEESRDFLCQFDWAKDILASDHGEEKVYYVAGTRSSNGENVKSLMKKDEWMEQVMCEVGFVDLEEMEEARVPLLIEDKSEEGFISISPDAHGVKGILPGQDGLQGGEAVLPQTIWTECFECEGQSYEIMFERVSPIYSIFTETGGCYADYCLRVKDGQGNAISEQMIVYFPVTYEEVYWLVDFSGNGFMDIAFCVDTYFSKYGWTELTTLIWNSEKKLYEKKKFPACREVSERYWMEQLWNRESSSVISFVGRTEIGDAIMERYLFSEGAWKCIGRLEPFYAEDSMGELQRQGYLELSFSTEGEQVEKNVIEEGTEAVWLNKESLWSEYNMNNLRLYPYAFGWEEIETNIGEIDISKYVRVEDK